MLTGLRHCSNRRNGKALWGDESEDLPLCYGFYSYGE